MDSLKQVPYSLEAEQSVIGSILIDPMSVDEVCSDLKSNYFYIKSHREIFECILEMYNLNIPIDAVTLLDKVKSRGNFDEGSGKEYLFGLAQTVPSSKNIKKYAQIIIEKYILRELISASSEINDTCYEAAEESRILLDLAEQKIYNISNGIDSKEFVPISAAVVETIEKLHMLSGDDKEKFLGLQTYFSDLDRLLAARPGMGKTSFALNIAQNIASKTDKAVVVFSLEMSTQQLAERMLSSEAMVNSDKLRTGDIPDDDWERIAMAAGILGHSKILFDDTPGATVMQMKSKVRKVKNLGLIVIDYLQLMSTNSKSSNRVQEVSELSRNLKIMAKELNVPIITLSQLSRGPESRENKRPMMSDLRESGGIEQDADVVMFLYRDDYYNKDTENQNECECIVAKNRHGKTGTAKLQWIGEYTRFTSQERIHNEY
ncbi:MAG: replicative DNA helicase [Clostridia bacterium]